MRTLLLSCAALLTVSASACSRTSPPSSSTPDAAAPVASSAETAVAASIRDAGAADAGRARLTAAQRSAVLRDLEAGRKLARAKNWNSALEFFTDPGPRPARARPLVIAPPFTLAPFKASSS